MAEKYGLGVDFGGTKISAGVVNLETGKLLGAAKKKTRQGQDEEDIAKRLALVIEESLNDSGIDRKKIVGIGIGVAGMVDRQKGILLFGPNIGARNIPITEPISQQFKIPTYLGNDVEVATIGEQNFGAGKKCSNFICIFVGTGIGAGIVFNGTIYRGATGFAGEIGHTLLFPDGKSCGCGAYGCLEAYASRTALAKGILTDLNRGIESTIKEKVDLQKGILRSKAISNALAAGDKVVTSNLHECARYFGMGLVSIVNFYDPARIIVGGGLVEAVPEYLEIAESVLKRKMLNLPRKQVELLKAQLGDFAGIIGAAVMAKGPAF
jgi:glucokinase